MNTIRVNFLFNVAGTVLPLASALVTIPIYIIHIGAARYGILSVVWILLGYFGFLDFGLSRASANALSRLGTAGPSERVPVLVTSLYLNLFLGIIGGLVLFFASGFLLNRFSTMSSELAGETMAAMPWIAAMLPVALVSAVGAGAMESRERFFAVNVFQTFGGVLGQVAPVICALLIGPSLTVVIPAAFLSRLVSTIGILIFVCRTEHPVNPRSFDRRRVRELLGYGAWVSVTSVVSPLLATFDQVLIGAVLGPAAIAHYAVPMNLATRTQVISTALAKTLFPRLSRLAPEEARQLAARATISLVYCFGALCAPAVIMAGPFLRLWVGEDFASYATPIAELLLIGAWTNGIAFIPYTLLQGQGRPDLTAKIHAAEVVPFFAGLWLLTTNFGLPGAALAWSIRTTLDGFVLLKVARCWNAQLLRGLPALILLVACFAVARLAAPPLVWATLVATIMGLAMLALGVIFDPALRTPLLAMLPARATLRRP
jgi:O-antigen/teichoic acid export membrane protein